MILLTSGGIKNLIGYRHSEVGQLIVPGDGNLPQYGRVWGVDNGAFNGLEENAFLTRLKHSQSYIGCKFLAVPDVVGDHEKTLEQFYYWEPLLRDWPLAFVLQDGCNCLEIPWESISAVFVGGTTEFKYSMEAIDAVNLALHQGLWVHWGRVNTQNRVRYILGVGGHSFDGSSFSQFPKNRKPIIELLRKHRRVEGEWVMA